MFRSRNPSSLTTTAEAPASKQPWMASVDVAGSLARGRAAGAGWWRGRFLAQYSATPVGAFAVGDDEDFAGPVVAHGEAPLWSPRAAGGRAS